MEPQQPQNQQPNPQQQPYPYPPQQQYQSPVYGQQGVPQPTLPLQPPPQPTVEQQTRPTSLHPMVVLQPGERVVAIIKRHPFGILSLYVMAMVGILVVTVLGFYFLPKLLESYGGDANVMFFSGLAIVIAALVLVLGIATSVYWQNQWTVTSDSITQISQKSLFARQVSQLSMDNLEDVTVDQDGILQQLFNFGTLKVETAGERSKFQFIYCPRPNEYARRILEAHELFLEDRRNVQNTP